jgi:hypothetical protein
VQHRRDLPHESIAYRAAAHSGDGAQDDRGPDIEPEGQCLARPDHREHAQPDGVQHDDRHLEAVQPLAQGECDQPPTRSERQVAPVAKGSRRYRADEDVADDAPAQGGDHAEGEYADDVQAGGMHRSQRAVEREREGAGQIQREQQRQLGCHSGCLPLCAHLCRGGPLTGRGGGSQLLVACEGCR